MRKRLHTRNIAVAAVVIVGGLSALAATAVAGGPSPEPARGESEEKTIQVSDEARAAIDSGVTLADWDAAYDAMTKCVAPATKDAMSGPVTDLSGLRRLYTMSGATEGELTLLTEDHDKCYETHLMAIDIEYQLGTEATVNAFYGSLSACAAGSSELAELRLRAPVARSWLGEVDAVQLDGCLQSAKG